MNSILICTLLVLAPIVAQSQDTLQLVHVFFRHGSRTPEEKDTYPNDIYSLKDFQPMGWGQLTNGGKQRAYKLGKMLRERYDTFLGELYTSDLVEAISTDFDRTKMSALLVLAGLFPPSVSQQWDENLAWLPIPYYFDKDKHDYFIRRPTHYCPAYVRALEEASRSEEQRNITRQFEDVFEYISKETGRSITSLYDVFRIYQTLNAEENMNFTLPAWTKTVYPEPISTLAGLQCQLENSNTVLKRLNGGRSLQKVVEHMKAKVDGELQPEGRKIYLYSGHENNVLNIQAALNVFRTHVPKYSAATIIELHYYPDKKEHGVKVFYAKEVGQPPIELRIPGCNKLCTLDSFTEAVKNHIPINYTQECQAKEDLGA